MLLLFSLQTDTALTTSGTDCYSYTGSCTTTDTNNRSGRWRSQYSFDPSSGSISGSIKIDVHYYEDGNVRLQTEKPVSASLTSSASAAEIVKQIATVEKKYQEELNRAFISLSEGAFKNLRRQLPVTRQKVEWEKISGYRVSRFT